MSFSLGSLMTWEDIYNKFIKKIIPIKKIQELRAKIAAFTQMEGEHFHKTRDSFKLFLTQCLHHIYPLQL